MMNENFTQAREQMLQEQIIHRGITDPQVVDAMRRVPRHEFVPLELQSHAYEDHPLTIGHDQTISQPYIVALMTDLLQLSPDDHLLEIGVGSGYQTAILAEIVSSVIGIELVPQLADEAQYRLELLGYENITVLAGDGSIGLPDYAPYDAILAAAAAPTIPPPLMTQLADGGRLVMPIGERHGIQIIERVTRRGGAFHIERLLDVRFVPMLGQFGYPS